MQLDESENHYCSGDSAHANPYRLDVFSDSVREVVAEAGGWIVDRVLAGWRVTLITDAEDGECAGRILGCEVTIGSEITDASRPRPYGIVLTSARCRTDSQLQQCIANARDRQIAEISLIGVRPSGRCCDPRLRPVVHRLSPAAQAFKAHALLAVGLPDSSVGVTERFLSAALGEPNVANAKCRSVERRRETARNRSPGDGDAVSSY
jgi:hypothetical protein